MTLNKDRTLRIIRLSEKKWTTADDLYPKFIRRS